MAGNNDSDVDPETLLSPSEERAVDEGLRAYEAGETISLEELKESRAKDTTCPCCGYPTLLERNAFGLCPLCDWEDEPGPSENPDSPSPSNHGYTLTEARENFKRFLTMYRPDDKPRFALDLLDRELKKEMVEHFELFKRSTDRDRQLELAEEINALFRRPRSWVAVVRDHAPEEWGIAVKEHRLKEMDFYFITDSELSRQGTLRDVEAALDAGCRIVQYREKNKPTREMVEEAAQMKELCLGRAIFLVNDRVDVALAVNADGVHIGQDDTPFDTARRLLGEEKIIGLTTHNLEESRAAEEMGADYIGLSPIYSTTTKKDAGEGQGPRLIREVAPEMGIPVVAIGGITRENLPEVMQAGADAAVAISAVLCAADAGRAVAEFIRIIRENRT